MAEQARNAERNDARDADNRQRWWDTVRLMGEAMPYSRVRGNGFGRTQQRARRPDPSGQDVKGTDS